MKLLIIRVLFFFDIAFVQLSFVASSLANFGGSMVGYDGSRIPDCLNFIDPVTKQPYYHTHSSNCSRFWECGPESGVTLFECAHCPDDDVMCRNQQALSFDMRYQYPDGPVCDWPSNVDCDNDGDEHHYVSIESTTHLPTPTSSQTSTSLASTWPPWAHPSEGCLEYDGSRVPDCREFVNDQNNIPYYHYHSSNCSRFWECSPNYDICLFECPSCLQESGMCEDQSALTFDQTIQYPVGPVCDWPSNLECGDCGCSPGQTCFEGNCYTQTTISQTTISQTTISQTTISQTTISQTTTATPSTTSIIGANETTSSSTEISSTPTASTGTTTGPHETTESTSLMMVCPFNNTTPKEDISETCISSTHSCCHPMSETLSTIIGVATVGLALLGTFGNGFSLAAIATQLIGNEGTFSSKIPDILLINLCVFDILYSCVVLPIFASVFLHNGWPSSSSMCKWAGLGTHWVIYGERMALAVIAVNTTRALGKAATNEKSSLFSIISKILFPWVFGLLIILPTYLELSPVFGTFGYIPSSGECNIVNPQVFSVLEVFGTYVPFVLMVSSYAWIDSKVWKRQSNLRKSNPENMQMLYYKKIQRAKLICIMVLVYGVCCLPFSLKNALSLWFPLADQNILNGPLMLSVLYFLCASQFSLNFVIYTIIPNPMREAHKNMWMKIWTYLCTVLSCSNGTNTEIPIVVNSISVISESSFSDSSGNISYRTILQSSSTDSESIPTSPSMSDNGIVEFLTSPTIVEESEYYSTRC